MIRGIRRPSRKTVVLAALPLLTAVGGIVGVAANASQPSTTAQLPCTTFLVIQYKTVGAACAVDQGQNGVGGIAVTYPGGAEVGGSVHIGDDVYGAGASTQGTKGTLTICDGPYPYYCTNTPF